MLNHGVVRLRVTTSKWGRVRGRFAWVGPIQEKDHHVGMELVFSCPVESGTLRKHARNQVHCLSFGYPFGFGFSTKFAIPLKVLVVKSSWD